MARATFHPLAELELIEAAQYYEKQSPGLGERFLDAAERCEQLIVEYPEAGAAVSDRIRRRLVQTFPYALLYSTTGEGVRILAVANLRRRPSYWTDRE